MDRTIVATAPAPTPISFRLWMYFVFPCYCQCLYPPETHRCVYNDQDAQPPTLTHLLMLKYRVNFGRVCLASKRKGDEKA